MAGRRRVPARIGVADVARLEAEIELLRGLDYRRGGAACRDAVIVTAAWHGQLLRSAAAPAVRARLRAALADAHNLAGWTCFDTGLDQAAEGTGAARCGWPTRPATRAWWPTSTTGPAG